MKKIILIYYIIKYHILNLKEGLNVKKQLAYMVNNHIYVIKTYLYVMGCLLLWVNYLKNITHHIQLNYKNPLRHLSI